MHYSIADYLLDIGQNAFEAKATEIEITLNESEEKLLFEVKDNVCGMNKKTLVKALDPFYSDPTKHSTRKVGFGLSFLKQAAEVCDGGMELISTIGKGTTVAAWFRTGHIDTPPLGDMATTILALFTMDGDYNLSIHHKKNDTGYSLSRQELLEALGDLAYTDSLSLAKTFIISQENELQK